MNGHALMETGEIKDLRVTLSDLQMESLPQYFLSFKEAVPLNIGFSGLSSLELSMEGTLDHLAIHANWDLSSTLLSYARYFSKPKDVPLNLNFDFILKDSDSLAINAFLKQINSCSA